MSNTDLYTPEQSLSIVHQGLSAIGYRDNLLKRNYSFLDFIGNRTREIELAAFGQEPLSPRSACFGATVPFNDSAEAIAPYLALGAPQILALYLQSGEVGVWKMVANGTPVMTGRLQLSNLSETLVRHREEIAPEQILRAKSVGFHHTPTQLSLFDFDPDLVPALEERLGRKLDNLLSRVISHCKTAYAERHKSKFPYIEMARLVFRLIAAKLLIDRQHPVAHDWSSYDAGDLIRATEMFYFGGDSQAELVLSDADIQNLAWDEMRRAFSFKNVSVEVFAYIYENTLVNQTERKESGIHATPQAVAEYLVRQLPFEELDLENCHIFEPFSGHAPFLVAAMGRLRPLLLPLGIDEAQHHEYFRKTLSGMEAEPFAREVGQRSLTLADYSNKDHWDIKQDNVYTSPDFETYLKRASVVLCNPPFEKFDSDYRESHAISSFRKGAEALVRVLEFPPPMLGFVLPRSFIDGQDYRIARAGVDKTYNHIETVRLPDNTFVHSNVEPILLIAYGKRTSHPTRRSTLVEKPDYKHFKRTYEPTWSVENPLPSTYGGPALIFWSTPLQRVWDALLHSAKFESIADPHRGIEYNISVEKNESLLFSEDWKPGFTKGLRNVPASGLEPYLIKRHIYLNMDERYMLYKAYRLPWDQPKVIANAARIKGDRWVMAATVDEENLVCYQRFHGIWPKGSIPPEVIAALLNGPVANAYLSSTRKWGDLEVRAVRQIPIPTFSTLQIQSISSLVRAYANYRQEWLEQKGPLFDQPNRKEELEKSCRDIMWQLDAEVLAAYKLELSLERELLGYFEGYNRPGPFEFSSSPLGANHPLAGVFGSFDGEPLWDDWMHAIEEYRRETNE